MKTYFFLLFISFCSAFGQTNTNIEVTYLYSHPKSKSIPEKSDEVYKLFINKDKSFYLSETKYKNDSIRQAIRESGNINLGSINTPLLTMYETVEHDFNDNSIITYKHILGNPIGYRQSGVIDWKIMDEKKIVENIPLTKAQCNFGGRQWTAWFSRDYPVSEGPFKFKNLPGLIFEVADSENIFNYKLLKIKKKDKPFVKDYSMFKVVSKADYKQMVNTAVENPAPGFFEHLSVESQNKMRQDSRKKFNGLYYPEKEFE